MAVTARRSGRLWSRLHFLVRFLGVSGLLVGAGGLTIATQEKGTSWEDVRPFQLEFWRDLSTSFPVGGEGLTYRVAFWLAAAGVAWALVALLIEVLAVSRLAAGRRSAFGINAVLQAALALALLIGLNVFSLKHFVRLDWTRNHQFTLPQEIQDQLRQLKGETTIVVYKQHKTFGRFSEKTDAYDYAGEEKVVEKVEDLVEQFREFGPKFKVIVLDVKDKEDSSKRQNTIPFYRHRKESYQEKVQGLPEELKQAIEKAPENSIFFHTQGSPVQRLSFNDFYLLDKGASQEDGNLVLMYQGIEAFTRKVLNIDEKKPRVAVATAHEILSLEGSEEYGMAGVKKSLKENGFESRDLILKKWTETAPPEPALLTFDESKFERLEEQQAEVDVAVKGLEELVKELNKALTHWKKTSLEELTKENADRLPKGKKITEAIRNDQVSLIEDNITIRTLQLDRERQERTGILKEKEGLNIEGLEEQRRISDLKAKTERMLADCDLLILPRWTLMNVARGDRIGNWVYRLDDAQVAAVKDFLKAGKPVLCCFGPLNEPPGRMDPMGSGPDGVEDLLGQLGVKLSRQTVLFNVESKSFAERRGGLLVLGANVELPSVDFSWKPGAGRPLGKVYPAQSKANPIRQSMRLLSRSVENQNLELRIRHPRPIYYEPPKGVTPKYEAEFIMTSAESWNEDQPFPTRERTPRYEPGKPDPSKGTLEEKRMGPFPIGVAIETPIPGEWYEDKNTKPARARVAVVGHGGLFVGQELKPAQEKLLLDTCNWLLGRDDRLPRSDVPWSYPRVNLERREQFWWRWGTWLGLPGLFAYLGLVVLMVRRLR